ncbi:MAG: helix-turn-helix transcriptional regulator [Clostridia bacterium]|nr:helix-turn-helix transcriptional regulator [Clostridia bacterium]
MLFNEKLKMLRKESGFTQEGLAEKLNVSRQAITKWETGEGTPDIENLKLISNLFNTTIDDLVKEEKDVNIDAINQFKYSEELEINHTKHFDINLGKFEEVNILPTEEEKVKVELLSSKYENINELFKIKFDELYNKLDIDIKNSKIIDNIILNIYLPEKYIEDIELNTKIKTLNISDIEISKLEFDGELKYINVKNSKGKVVLNTTRCDIEADYDKLDGELEVNIVNSTARVQIPKGSKYKTILKGKKNQFINENVSEDATNIIELNGLNSKLIIIEK